MLPHKVKIMKKTVFKGKNLDVPFFNYNFFGTFWKSIYLRKTIIHLFKG